MAPRWSAIIPPPADGLEVLQQPRHAPINVEVDGFASHYRATVDRPGHISLADLLGREL